MKNIGRALQFFRPDSARLALVLMFSVASIVGNVIKPWPIALIVDSVLQDRHLPQWLGPWTDGGAEKAWLIVIFSASLFAIHALQGLLSAAQNFTAIQIGLRGLTRVRSQVFATLQRLSLRFHQGARVGDLVYRASWDTYSFQTLFQQGVLTFLNATLSLLLMVAVMWQVNAKLTLVALATLPLVVATIRIFGARMRARGTEAQQADSRVMSLVQQNISALPLIQSYTREEHEQRQFDQQVVVAQQRRLSQHGWELIYWFAISVVFAGGTAATVWIGSNEVLAQRLTVGQLVVFLAYLGQMYEPLNQLSHVGATTATALVATQRVFELIDTPEEVRDAENARAVQGPKSTVQSPDALVATGRVSFDNISFGYEKERLVLHNVALELQPGESCAVIGPSGAGKSTLMNLVPRFFDPNAGAVKLDGVDLRKLRLKDLRAQIAVVLQEPILLPATISENIAYGKPHANQQEIEAAARAANAHEFIAKLPQKYHTLVGEGAVRLSVGERQRINIARAFLKDAPILLLDEPTSALDADSEQQVVASIFELMRGRTTLMVAHRLSTIRRVDKVVVLENGCVTECGSPEELLMRGGYFARVASGQVSLT
ncbi:MAG TPA: ABC transporter ATP-binding protein [Methylomirabilota bacterium]|nr:ABC transporter ATP-binding protein [Methylomirabilota bacterium]